MSWQCAIPNDSLGDFVWSRGRRRPRVIATRYHGDYRSNSRNHHDHLLSLADSLDLPVHRVNEPRHRTWNVASLVPLSLILAFRANYSRLLAPGERTLHVGRTLTGNWRQKREQGTRLSTAAEIRSILRDISALHISPRVARSDRRSISSGPRATFFHASWPLGPPVSYCAIILNLLCGILLARAPLLLLTRSTELFRFFSFFYLAASSPVRYWVTNNWSFFFLGKKMAEIGLISNRVSFDLDWYYNKSRCTFDINPFASRFRRSYIL
mgnify:CR=1 FL=1